MTTYIAKMKHGPDEDSITTIQFPADDDAQAHQYLAVLGMLLRAKDYDLTAREDRTV